MWPNVGHGVDDQLALRPLREGIDEEGERGEKASREDYKVKP